MKLLIDMNLSPRWVTVLSAEGFEAVHWSRVGAVDATDTEIMLHAQRNGEVVLTHDLDYGSILAATNGEKPSVVQIRSEDTSPEIIGLRVVQALRCTAAELDSGALLTIDIKRVRLTLLALRVSR